MKLAHIDPDLLHSLTQYWYSSGTPSWIERIADHMLGCEDTLYDLVRLGDTKGVAVATTCCNLFVFSLGNIQEQMLYRTLLSKQVTFEWLVNQAVKERAHEINNHLVRERALSMVSR